MRLFKGWKTECRPTALAAVLLMTVTVLEGLLGLVLLPKQDFSENENRALAPLPVPSLSTVLDGRFMKSAEDYVGDHFPLRGFFITLNTEEQLLLGKRDLAGDYSSVPADGGVYFGKNGHLYEVLLPDKTGTFRDNADGLAEFAKKSGVPVTILPVPSGSQEQPENLPLSAPNHDQREELDELKQAVGRSAQVVDLFSQLSLKETGQDYYFKTDHHWNAYGAYVGYKALAGAMGFSCVPQGEFDFRSAPQPFYGTLYSKAVSVGQEADTLLLPYAKDAPALTQQVGQEEHDGIYWDEYLTKKDKYSAFLGGNPAVTVVRNPAAKGGKLLLLKDSYANAMVPFLAENFSEIHLIDLRYYSLDIYKYIQQNGIDQAAAVYSIKQLCDVPIANKLRR